MRRIVLKVIGAGGATHTDGTPVLGRGKKETERPRDQHGNEGHQEEKDLRRYSFLIIEMIHYSDELPVLNYSEFISEKLNYDYTYLSNIFSEVRGITIQQFIIINKIERVKELLLYDELNLTEISYKLHYSSVAHLSNQFKKVTGLSPSFFKQLKQKRKSNLENM